MRKVLKMKNLFLFLSIVVLTSGCASFDARRLENSVKKYANVVEKVCTAAEIFDAAGVEFPGVEQCRKTMKAIDVIKDRADALAITEALGCIDSYVIESPDFVMCVAKAQDWQKIAKRISKKM